MAESLGARLRKRREEQNIALGTIAEQTKIKLSLLEELERDDVSHWPSGIFRRAYIRAYAAAIGVSPDATLREFLEVCPDPDESVAAAAAMTAAAERADTGCAPPSRLRYIVGSALESFSRLRRPPVPSSIDQRPSRVVETPTIEPGDDLLDFAGDEAAANVALAETASDDPPGTQPEMQASALEEIPVATAGETLHFPEPRLEAPVEPEIVQPDLPALGRLCTELGRVETADALEGLLAEAARIIGTTGLIVWRLDAAAAGLRPALAHGYSDRVLAQLPIVTVGEDNATAAAFRLAQTCVIEGDDRTAGAVVVPLLTPSGCSGVLALELPHGAERSDSVRAAATIVAAMLAQLLGGEGSAAVAGATTEDSVERELVVPSIGQTRPVRVNVRSDEYARGTPVSIPVTAARVGTTGTRRPSGG